MRHFVLFSAGLKEEWRPVETWEVPSEKAFTFGFRRENFSKVVCSGYWFLSYSSLFLWKGTRRGSDYWRSRGGQFNALYEAYLVYVFGS